ncbi:MAG: glycosyltransferase family 39 protein [candidate division Zixibacteria bacterium]|nr:glycosyltransferase family 39 protein [candidate division Zixibacteria bacterium]
MKFIKNYHDYRIILGYIFCLALALRFAIFYFWAWDTGPHYEYVEIARYIVAGYGHWWDWFGSVSPQPSAAFVPLYSYFLAFFIALTNDPARWIYFAQVLLNALGVYAFFLLGKHWGGKKIGLVAAGLYAMFPEIAFMPTRMVPEAIIVGPVILTVYLYLKIKSGIANRPQYRSFFWLGVFIGFLSLMKGSLVFLFLGCFLGLLPCGLKKMPVRRGLLFLSLGFLIAISPWIIRNTIVLGQPVFRTTYGYNLWRGNYPGASGTGRLHPGDTREVMPDDEYFDYINRNQPEAEIEIDRFFTDEALRFIKQDPGNFIMLSLKRSLYFITYDPTHPLARNWTYLGGYVFAVIFGLWGAILLKRQKRFDMLFIAVPLLHLILYAPVMVLPRYRVILVWFLVSLASVSIALIMSRLNWYSKWDIDKY